MKQVIYETKGRAREFNELALNLYSGCGHQCIYCYGADVTHQTQSEFNQPVPRVTVDDIRRSAERMAQAEDKRRVLLCFVTDPYNPLEDTTELTRAAIKILHLYGINVEILTKGGQRSVRDFDLLSRQDAYATTLTLVSETDRKIWEPGAAPFQERLEALKTAHNLGIETWVSFEPVIYPDQTIAALQCSCGYAGHYKVGTMNYHPQGKETDWKTFGWSMKTMLDDLGQKYYFKRDLLRKMGIEPELFEQTWICR